MMCSPTFTATTRNRLSGVDACIAESWRRCVHSHNLNPENLCEAVVLPNSRLREHQDAIGGFTDIARYGLKALWRQIRDMGYVVLVAEGVVADSLCSGSRRAEWKQARLYLGALWHERQNGTSAVGMVPGNRQTRRGAPQRSFRCRPHRPELHRRPRVRFAKPLARRAQRFCPYPRSRQAKPVLGAPIGKAFRRPD